MNKLLVASIILFTGCGDITKSLDEGYAYGESHTLGQCFESSMNKLNACSDISCAMENMGFPRGCAKTASFDAEFCSSVPNEVIAASIAMKKECSNHKFEKACYKYMQQPITRCLNESNS